MPHRTLPLLEFDKIKNRCHGDRFLTGLTNQHKTRARLPGADDGHLHNVTTT